MKRLLPLLAAGMLVFAVPAFAKQHAMSSGNDSIWIGSHGSFMSWRPVARDELIVWASPGKAYLVKIWRPFRSLRFVDTVGVTRTGGRVTTFDRVIVAGQRLPIKSIRRLNPAVARAMAYGRA